jgi:signal peptidase I
MTDSLLSATPNTINPASPSQPRARWKKPVLALFFSLLADGLGQIYNGELIKGLAFALAGWILVWLGFSYLMSSFSGFILFIVLSLAFKTYLCVNAFIIAKKFQVDATLARVSLVPRIAAATLVIGVALCVSSDPFIKKFFAFHAFRVPSASMCPTICEGDRIVADMRAFRQDSPRRGNVVMFLFDSESTLHIKRVVAVGGDNVSASHGRVIVNGSPVGFPVSACGTPAAQTNNYEASPDLAPLRVPPDKLFLVGDDLDHSYDSRYYGTVEVTKVRARPVYLYWSPQHARIGCAIK